MNAFDTHADAQDPRVCQQRAVRHLSNGSAVLVTLKLGRAGSEEIAAVHLMTPAQARELALELYEAAQDADREMDAAVRVSLQAAAEHRIH